MNISEENLVSWSKGPGQTEADKCSNAETAVRKAVKASERLAALDVSVFAQGSYSARTNVRQNSDVDICVRYDSAFFPDYPKGATGETFGHVEGSLPPRRFQRHGPEGASRTTSARLVLREATRHLTSMPTHTASMQMSSPTFEHRMYTGRKNADGSHHYLSGIAFDPDSGSRVINWPEQTYDNGVDRNTATGRKYKQVIRILKRLRDRMQDDGIAISKKTPSFLIECLVWNADVDAFSGDTYTAIVRHLLADLWNRTRKDDDCSEWGEVNELKYLFRLAQPWTRQEANEFLQAAWDYVGYQ